MTPKATAAVLLAVVGSVGCRSEAESEAESEAKSEAKAGAKESACDEGALSRAVNKAEEVRRDAKEGEGWPSGVHARDAVLAACPTLPEDVRIMLNFAVDTADGQRGAKPLDAVQRKTFQARRESACKDPSVIGELPSLGPAERGPTKMARCGFADEYRLGTPLGEAFARLDFLAPILRQHLIDQGIDSKLATQTVEMFGYPVTAP